MFEGTGYEHDMGKTLLERSHIYRIRFRNSFRPASEPLSTSRPQKELDTYPHKNITTGCIVPGQVNPLAQRTEQKM